MKLPDAATPAWDRIERMAGADYAQTHTSSEVLAEAMRKHPLNCQCSEFCAPLAEDPHPYDDQGRLRVVVE